MDENRCMLKVIAVVGTIILTGITIASTMMTTSQQVEAQEGSAEMIQDCRPVTTVGPVTCIQIADQVVNSCNKSGVTDSASVTRCSN